MNIARVPCRHDHAAIGRICFDGVDALSELINALPRVVGVFGYVGGSKVAPLKAVHGTEITHFASGKAQPVQELARRVAVLEVDVFL